VLPHRAKFPKVIKLLYRWIKEYMNMSNREYIFAVLQNLTQMEWLAEERDSRQDVIMLFEYVLTYNKDWFEQDEKTEMLGKAWQLQTVLQCQCFTDDAFTMTTAITKMNTVFSLIEKQKEAIDAHLEDKAKREASKLEAKIEAAKQEPKKEMVKMEASQVSNGKVAKLNLAAPVAADASPQASPASPGAAVKKEEDGEDFFGAGCDDDDDEEEEEEDCEDDEALSDEEEAKKEDKVKEEKKASCIDLDSDAESIKQEISSGSEESGDVGEVESSSEAEETAAHVFPVPSAAETLVTMREAFVNRCLLALFRNRGPLWARSKVDNFFQEIYYRRECLAKEQQSQVEAWQARIKVLQKDSEHKVGEANNNPLESHRPVVDSRELRQVTDADSNTWASKQTFDAREVHGGRQVLR